MKLQNLNDNQLRVDGMFNSTLTLLDAEARVINVAGQFLDLAAYLDQQRDESTDATTPGAPPPSLP